MDERLIIGKIYAYSNPSMPGVLKIGSTRRPIKERTAEANNQGTFGIPTPWKLELLLVGVEDYEKKEKSIHKLLANKRITPKKEQFKDCSLEELKLYFDLVGGKAVNLNEIDTEHEEHERLKRQRQPLQLNDQPHNNDVPEVIEEVVENEEVSFPDVEEESNELPSSLGTADDVGQKVAKVRINISKGSNYSKYCLFDITAKQVSDLDGSELIIEGSKILNLSQFARLATQEYNRANSTTLKAKNYSHCRYSFDDDNWFTCDGNEMFKLKKE